MKHSTVNSLLYLYLHISPILIFCIPLSTLTLSFLLTYSLCILSIFPTCNQSSVLLRFFHVETVEVRVNIAQNISLLQNNTQYTLSNARYTALFQCLLRSPSCTQAETNLRTYTGFRKYRQYCIQNVHFNVSLRKAAITKCPGGCRFPTQ